MKFNPVDKSITRIAPDFADDLMKWSKGAMPDNGVIYCPSVTYRGILKIDTKTDTVTDLDFNLLPERGFCNWMSCAAAPDGCIYFMPFRARRIMKLDPTNNEAISSVGVDLGDGLKYRGTVVGIDGCVYGIPYVTKRIVKYDPINDITSFVGEETNEVFGCCGDGILGRDGCIYAFAENGRILKIDATNNVHSFVGNSIESNHHHEGWGDAILGIDGCIYSPPTNADLILKYDHHSNQTSLVGDNFGWHGSRWNSGALEADGVIYCISSSAYQILAIDPLGEFSLVTKTNMKEHPEELGFLFRINDTDTTSNRTSFD